MGFWGFGDDGASIDRDVNFEDKIIYRYNWLYGHEIIKFLARLSGTFSVGIYNVNSVFIINIHRGKQK